MVISCEGVPALAFTENYSLRYLTGQRNLVFGKIEGRSENFSKRTCVDEPR